MLKLSDITELTGYSYRHLLRLVHDDQIRAYKDEAGVYFVKPEWLIDYLLSEHARRSLTLEALARLPLSAREYWQKKIERRDGLVAERRTDTLKLKDKTRSLILPSLVTLVIAEFSWWLNSSSRKPINVLESPVPISLESMSLHLVKTGVFAFGLLFSGLAGVLLGITPDSVKSDMLTSISAEVQYLGGFMGENIAYNYQFLESQYASLNKKREEISRLLTKEWSDFIINAHYAGKILIASMTSNVRLNLDILPLNLYNESSLQPHFRGP